MRHYGDHAIADHGTGKRRRQSANNGGRCGQPGRSRSGPPRPRSAPRCTLHRRATHLQPRLGGGPVRSCDGGSGTSTPSRSREHRTRFAGRSPVLGAPPTGQHGAELAQPRGREGARRVRQRRRCQLGRRPDRSEAPAPRPGLRRHQPEEGGDGDRDPRARPRREGTRTDRERHRLRRPSTTGVPPVRPRRARRPRAHGGGRANRPPRAAGQPRLPCMGHRSSLVPAGDPAARLVCDRRGLPAARLGGRQRERRPESRAVSSPTHRSSQSIGR